LSADGADPALLKRHAAGFFEAGRIHEAMALLEKAPDEPLLERIRGRAIGEGDAFVLAWIERIGKTKVTREDWSRLAAEARSRGKEAFAAAAERRASE
jgi:hypothetical protein